jgi:hypothetical protein
MLYADSIIRKEGSIGEYVAGQCPTCRISGRFHEVLVCRNCGAPPAGDGKCVCDWRPPPEPAKGKA